ncbi:MAG: hypothetical protein V4537_11550 [Pseudomonadota bacterium]
MNAWPFIVAAYALTLGTTVALAAVAFAAMRRAEAAVDKLKRP